MASPFLAFYLVLVHRAFVQPGDKQLKHPVVPKPSHLVAAGRPHILKSPTTLTRMAQGAHTAKYTPLTPLISMTWAPMSGSYRIIADQANKYFRIHSITGSNPTVLSDDGSGALWVIGNSVGKPKVSTNEVGWTTENALCMAPVADKVYQITFIGGKTVKTDGIDFKFFGQMGWGVELKGSVNYVEVPSALVGVGQGKDVNGHDDGNLFLLDGVTLQQDMRYVFTVDLTGGLNAAKFSVKEDGIDDTPVIEVPVLVNDTKIADSGTAMDLTQGMDISVSGTEIEYADPATSPAKMANTHSTPSTANTSLSYPKASFRPRPSTPTAHQAHTKAIQKPSG